MDNNIRKYEPRDRDDVLNVWERASAQAHPFLSDDFLAIERLNIANIILPNTETYVVEQENRVVGFISIYNNEVGLLFVQPESQGKGAGTALLDKAREVRGDLEVEVFKANESGCVFYMRYGFELLAANIHPITGDEQLRLKLSAAKNAPPAR